MLDVVRSQRFKQFILLSIMQMDHILTRALRMATRKRAAKACLRCKDRKAKCNDYRPCKRCLDSGPTGRDLCLNGSLSAWTCSFAARLCSFAARPTSKNKTHVLTGEAAGIIRLQRNASARRSVFPNPDHGCKRSGPPKIKLKFDWCHCGWHVARSRPVRDSRWATPWQRPVGWC